MRHDECRGLRSYFYKKQPHFTHPEHDIFILIQMNISSHPTPICSSSWVCSYCLATLNTWLPKTGTSGSLHSSSFPLLFLHPELQFLSPYFSFSLLPFSSESHLSRLPTSSLNLCIPSSAPNWSVEYKNLISWFFVNFSPPHQLPLMQVRAKRPCIAP